MTDTASPAVRFDRVVHAYGERRGVDGVTLDIAAGMFCVLLGPSGCGKTTLLKTVNRLLDPSSGRVFVEGVDIAATDPVFLRRRIGYAIQAVGLFPHMRVGANIATVPTLLGWSKERIDKRVAELLELVNLPSAEYRDRFPRELSGGQQQRVGLARALAGDPSILLMDEPFGAVDAIERAHLQGELRSLHQHLGKTVLFVTHDVDEALRLADLIVVMRDGRVKQAGSPLDVIARPASPFVADLVNAHDVLRLLGVLHAADAMRADGPASTASVDGRIVDAQATLREALSVLAVSGSDRVTVVRDNARAGSISLDDILATVRRVAARAT